MIHTRCEEWTDIPFASLEQAADFTAEFAEIVDEAMPDTSIGVSAQVEYEHGRSENMTPDEFKSAFSSLAPISNATNLTFSALPVLGKDVDPPAEDAQFSAFVSVRFSFDQWCTMLSVEGSRLTVVEGVKAAVKAAVERRVAAKQQQVEEAAQGGRDTEQSEALSPGHWLRSVTLNPWVVAIGGGVVAGLIIWLVT
jgi:hypothetical protein